MRFRVGDILEACSGLGAVMTAGSFLSLLSGVSTDSRSVASGQLFVALKGDNFDGHAFVAKALEQGAGAALVETGWLNGGQVPPGKAVIEIDDTLEGLGCLARWWRLSHRLPVLAVTGSIGKTSVKEMTASILSRSRRVLKNEGNLNNLIGLPLTLFGIDATKQTAVVELGINQFGEMERLVDIAQPQVGLITNIAGVHLEYLGDLDGVARAKTALWRGMGYGVAVYDPEDGRLDKAARESDLTRLTYGSAKGSQIRLTGVRSQGLDGIEVSLEVEGGPIKARVPVLGGFYALNAAAACAGAYALGATEEDMITGLAEVSLPGHRMRPVAGVGGLKIIDDAYNANPQAMEAAIKTLLELKTNGARAGAVLGQMAELGPDAEAAHRKLGALTGRLGLDLVIALGPQAGLVVEEALKTGVGRALIAEDTSRAAELVREELDRGDALLIKGSRVAALEKTVALLAEGK